MKQKDLQILAEWMYGDKLSDMVLPDECQHISIEFKESIGQLTYFDPIEFSNQLDMLEDKMIKEARIKRKEIFYRDKWTAARYFTDSEHFFLGAVSNRKIENEARLNAILKFAKQQNGKITE